MAVLFLAVGSIANPSQESSFASCTKPILDEAASDLVSFSFGASTDPTTAAS